MLKIPKHQIEIIKRERKIAIFSHDSYFKQEKRRLLEYCKSQKKTLIEQYLSELSKLNDKHKKI